MRTAMFGGSFNPIHNGHVQLAKAFIPRLDLDRVLIVPAFIPPHKQAHDMVSGEHRLEMCRLAFEGVDGVEVSDLELSRGGASFTYLTLQQLHASYPGDELFLITGADMFLTIETWLEPKVIFSLATVCGVPRNESSIAELAEHEKVLRAMGAKTEILDAGVMTVSSTQVRNAVKNGEDISSLVPKGVEEYIKTNNLYR